MTHLVLDDALELAVLERVERGGIRQRTMELHYLLTRHRDAPHYTACLSVDAVVRLALALEGLGYLEAADAPSSVAVRLTRDGRLRLEDLRLAQQQTAAAAA